MAEKKVKTKQKPSGEERGVPDLAAEEKKLKEAYPDQKIVKGSLRDAGAVPEFGNKRTVEIHCQHTNKVFRVATSDLHQVRYCKEAIKEIRLQRRKEQRKTKRGPSAPKAAAESAGNTGSSRAGAGEGKGRVKKPAKWSGKKDETARSRSSGAGEEKGRAKKPAAKKAVKVAQPPEDEDNTAPDDAEIAPGTSSSPSAGGMYGSV